MKFGYTIIYVENVMDTVDFYKKAFGLAEKMIHESHMYAEMETGKTVLAFASNEMAEHSGFDIRKNDKEKKPAGIEIAFIADDVQINYDRACSAGAISLLKPTEKP